MSTRFWLKKLMLQRQGFVAPILVIILVLISLLLCLIFQRIFRKIKWWFFYPELTIKQTKLDENDIRFPEVSSSNTSDNSNEMSTFLELPKQNINASKGNYFISSDNGILKILFEINKTDQWQK